MKKFFEDLIRTIKKEKPQKEKWVKLKTKICKKYKVKKIPTDTQILLNAKKKDLNFLKKYLTIKPTRTISGVAVCAVMTKPIPCPQKSPCIYCPGGPESVFGAVPQSYTGKEPATRRAIRNKFDPYLQVFNRLEQYVVSGHNFDKIELIIMGGTFPSFQKKYQEDFVKYALKAMNDFSSLFFRKNEFDMDKFKKFFELPADINNPLRIKSVHKKILSLKGKTTLEKEQKKNENSQIRCVGLTIETRPDYGKITHGNEMLRLGATRVEIGIQTVYDDVLEKIEREHSTKDTIDSIRTLKDIGFKINVHYMPGLFVSRKKDLDGLKKLFKDQYYRPDMLKIYPCMVLKGTKLYNLWKQGKYKPLTTEEAASLITDFKKYIPTYCRVMRVQRDIPTYMTEAGVDRTNLRQYIEEKMKREGIKCRCIRCRESGRAAKVEKIDFLIQEYEASKGKEFFISAEDVKNDVLIGFCRLRFPSQQLRKEITKDSALIRELHVFSPAVAIGEKSKTSLQHKGIGKKLVALAEKISKENHKNKVIIISGIGVRNYYRKLGYKKEGPYMVKNPTSSPHNVLQNP